MAYIAVQDFKFGLDRRRPRVAGVPGTLWTLTNAHLTRGGDIERAKKFAPWQTLGADTYGMTGIKNRVMVFGSVANPLVSAADVRYQRLTSASGDPMSGVLDAKPVDGALYVIARFSDGHVHHFYDGTRISDWDTVADAQASYETLADYLAARINQNEDVRAFSSGADIVIEALDAGVNYSVFVGATDGGGTSDQTITATTTIPNSAGSAATSATATVNVAGEGYLTALYVNGTKFSPTPTDLLRAPVEIVSDTSGAERVADAINQMTSVHGYSASASGSVVTVSAPASDGDAVNGRPVTATSTDGVVVDTTNFAGGVDAVDAVAKRVRVEFGGTFQPLDKFTVQIVGINGTSNYSATGRASATGAQILVHKSRVFSPAGSLLHYCKLNDPTNWTDVSASTGAGFLNLSDENEGAQRVVAAIARFNQVAIFSEEVVHLFNLGADAAEFASDYPVNGTGTIAPRAVVGYGNNDVFYLDRTGIRSLRARNSDGAAFVSDVGNAVDTHVAEFIRDCPGGCVEAARSVIDPESGRLWVAIDDRIYVFSHFPASKITAWSVYEPGFSIDEMLAANGRVYVRSGDEIYLYGGASGEEYPDHDEQTVTVEMPFMSAEKPATIKMLTGFDAVVSNVWDASLLVDPDDETIEITIGKIYRTTGSGPHIHIPGRSARAAVKMECSHAGKATISSVALHFEQEEQR